MLTASKAEEAYVKLERLGTQVIPAIICQMDDRRELAVKNISLENKYPNATEPSRQYSPKVVTDVLAAILNQVARNSFGFIYNGASEEELFRSSSEHQASSDFRQQGETPCTAIPKALEHLLCLLFQFSFGESNLFNRFPLNFYSPKLKNLLNLKYIYRGTKCQIKFTR